MRLEARYQYSENVATLKVLVPSFLMWGACLLAGLLLTPWYYVAWTDGDKRTQLLVNDVSPPKGGGCVAHSTHDMEESYSLLVVRSTNVYVSA